MTSLKRSGNPKRIISACLLFAIGGLFVASIAWGQRVDREGYAIEDGSKVVIDAKDHWDLWQSVHKTIQISEEGEVRPAFIRKEINAIANAAEFGGGIWAAGSNLAAAEALLDGDMNTFWEPDLADLPENWWVQIDLGRGVSATKIVLKFVGEELGDPFLHFTVTTSQGEESLGALQFRKVFRTDRPSLNQRVFEVDLTSLPPTKYPNVFGDYTGDMIRYVGVGVTDSNYGKAQKVSEAEYLNLAPEEQGDIEYFRREVSGRLRVLAGKEDWDALAESQKGPLVYYRRERPRLAEVEVWSIGDNIGVTVLDRGGKVTSSESNGVEFVLVDGDIYSTEAAPFWPIRGGYNPDKLLPTESPEQERDAVVDLGGAFFVDNIRLFFPVHPGPPRAYRIRLSDGSRHADGTLVWKEVGAVPTVEGRQLYHDHKFPLTIAKFFAYTYRLFVGQGRKGFAEVQLFGEGFMPESTIISNFGGSAPFIELGSTSQNLATIEWEADTPPGTDVILQTKTGDTVKNVTHYYKKNGDEYPGTEEEAKKEYETQKKFFGDASVGPIVTETIPGSDWSGWSERYFKPGDAIKSPSPRRFVSVQATFLTNDPMVSATLRSVTLNFVNPVARSAVGEILPPRLKEIGSSQELTYFIRPTFEAASRGFDDILIEAPTGVKMKFKQLKVDIEGSPTESYTAQSEGLQIISEESDSLWVRLPAVVKTTSGTAQVEVQFDATIFGFTTFFNGSIAHSSFEDSWQRVDDGNANGVLGDSEQTVVLALEGKEVLGTIALDREVFTPNADGINDELSVRFPLTRVSRATPVQVQIYDLSGRLMRELINEPLSTGLHTVPWTGVDTFGALVPPGVYLLRIAIDTDSDSVKNTAVNRLVHVVY